MYNEKKGKIFTVFICKEAEEQRGIYMGLVVIFALVTLLSVFSTLKTLKNKNMLGIAFSAATLLVFGWFTIMTVLNNGYPPAH
jgi:uncharacterized membrane protein